MRISPIIIRYRMHHIFSWLLVFGLWYFLRYQDFSNAWTAVHVTFIKTADLALMVYATNYLLIPTLLYRKKYAWFVLALVTMIVTGSILKMWLLSYVMHSPVLRDFSGNLKGRIYDNVIPHFLLVLTGAAFKLMSDYTRMQQRLVVMAKEKAEAELNFLKSQINPHFLFNSINAVYFLIDKHNTEARDALHKFSGMLRYQLYEMNGNSIPIEKELAYLKDYIDLQRLRKDAGYSVALEYPPAVKGFYIEPLLLIPFVENAFKHISHCKEQRNFIQLQLDLRGNIFYFNLVNSKEAVENNTIPHSGIGLVNVKRRLELLYPGKHVLDIKDTATDFTVALQLTITKQV
jgi:two-component system, LytTR family, sensor kinase